MSALAARLHHIATSTYPARPVAVVRILLGAAAFVRGGEAIRVFDRITPEETVKIPWAEWIPEPTTGLVSVVITVWVVAAALFAAGYRARVTGGTLAAAMAVSIGLDQQAYANHLYLLIILVALTALTHPDSAMSPKARRVGVAERVPAWPVLLIKIQVTVVYTFAGLTKLNDEFLGGGVLRGNLGRGFLDVPGWVTDSPSVEALAALVVVTELSIAALLWVPHRRTIAIGLGVLLHASIPVLLAGPIQLAVFSTEMVATYLLFLDTEPSSRIAVWDNSCDFCAGWKNRLARLDNLQTVDFLGSGTDAEKVRSLGIASEDADRAMQLIHDGRRHEGYRAVQGILSVSPWTYLVAPLLLLPPVRAIGERWYRRQADRRECGIPHSQEAAGQAPSTGGRD